MLRQHVMYQSVSKPMILPISDIACARASMSGLPVITLAPACPFSNTSEIHLLACYKAAYRTRRRHMHNRRCTHRCWVTRRSGRITGTAEVSWNRTPANVWSAAGESDLTNRDYNLPTRGSGSMTDFAQRYRDMSNHRLAELGADPNSYSGCTQGTPRRNST